MDDPSRNWASRAAEGARRCDPTRCSAAGDTVESELEWLRLQRRFAFRPQAMMEILREGSEKERRRTDGVDENVARLDPSDRSVPMPGMRADTGGDKAASRDQQRLQALGGRLLSLQHGSYPACLAALCDAPPVLLVRGCVCALAEPAVAIVGARAATRGALETARRLGRELAAQGLTVVSGLARGIDAEAHRGALEAGGRTVGVLAGGLDRVYPPEHRALVEEISRDGAVLSEVPLETPPRRELFSLRNRIISGLSLGVIVVEARRRSGSLITVRHALDQGREVWVVPGTIAGPFAAGSNRLLREGARAIGGAADVMEDLEATLTPDFFLSGARRTEEQRSAEPSEKTESVGDPAAADSRDLAENTPLGDRILAELHRGPANREELVTRVELDLGRLAEALLALELDGRIVEERDGRFHLCWG